MPRLSGLDISRNPLRCDEDLSAAIEYLTDSNVTPTESFHSAGTPKINEPYEGYSEVLSQWTDLAKRLCNKWDGGPPPRPAPRRVNKKPITKEQDPLISLPGPFFKPETDGLEKVSQ